MIISVHSYARALTKVSNHYVKSENFPDIAKYVYTPVFEKGDEKDKNNHRSISTLSNFSKN